MTNSYSYDPDTWPPALAGAVAGAFAAIVAAIIAFFLRSPDEIVANSLTVVLAALVIGVLSGVLWRRLRASTSAGKVFGWAMFGGFIAAMLGITLGDMFLLDNLLGYGAPIAAIIFLTLGFLVPLLATVKWPVWVAAIPILIALGLGVGLFGRGNVADGDLSLDDIPVVTTTTLDAQPSEPVDPSTDTTTTTASSSLSGEISIPDDLAESFTVSSAIATYSVNEILQGLSTVGVGESTSVTGTIRPGESFVFTLDLQSFVSDQTRRDSRVRGWFDEFPEGTFAARAFDVPSTATVGEATSFEITGDLTINDITLPSTWIVQARVEADGSLSIQAETDIILSDFDVPVISGGLVTMEDGAHLEVLLTATPE